jgi:membrane protease YdiL (CAAX protease family)
MAYEQRAMGSPTAWQNTGFATMVFLALPVTLTAVAVRLFPQAMPFVSWLGYAAFCWITILAVHRWTEARDIASDVFVFTRPRVLDLVVAGTGVVIGLFVIWPVSQILAHFVGAGVHGMDFDLRAAGVWTSVALWAVVTAPFCEELQFRGLAVAYFRARRWPAWAIVVASSSAFAVIHLPYFGIGLALFILFWSAMICAIRLWRQSLTPGLMLHVLNNIAAYLVFPLLHH